MTAEARVFSCHERAQLASGAETLWERLKRGAPAEPGGPEAQARLEEWQQVAAAGNPDLFDRRLAALGLTREAAVDLLGDAAWPKARELPGWIATIDAALAWAEQPFAALPFLQADAPLPFEDLLAPLTGYAVTELGLAVEAPALLTASLPLQRDLLVKLTNLAAGTLLEEFDLHRLATNRDRWGLSMPFGEAGCQTRYTVFVERQRSVGLRQVMLKRPVLARLLATRIEQWIGATSLLLDRLETFRCRYEAAGTLLGSPIAIRTAGSDPHLGGQQVAFVKFGQGQTIVYKPRSLAADHAWNNLLETLHASGAPASAGAVAIWPDEGHGWCTFIEPKPCADASDAETFFARAGAMLCLFHLLQGWDFHFENVIADGPAPVPVDLETLLHAWPPDLDGDAPPGAAPRIALRTLHDSVIATGYLPSWVVAQPGELLGIGGLNPGAPEKVLRLRFRHVNTDAMRIERQTVASERTSNLPTLNGQRLQAGDYLRSFTDGFSRMYDWLAAHREELCAPRAALDCFRRLRSRFILRPTQLYFLLLSRGNAPAALASGIVWSLRWDLLARFSEWTANSRTMQTIIADEHAAMANGDVPIFWADADDSTLIGQSAVLPNFFERPTFDLVVDRLRGLGTRSRDRQRDFIRQAIESDRSDTAAENVDEAEPTGTAHGRVATTPGQIAELLGTTAIVADDSAAWLGVTPLAGEARAQLEVAGCDLYSGVTGIALFLAAQYRVEGTTASRDLALQALSPLRSELAQMSRAERIVRRIGIGGVTGFGSLIYGFVRIAGLIEEPPLLDEAAALLPLLSDATIRQDQSFDLMSGSAGTILALLRLEEAAGLREAISVAERCADHLLSHCCSTGKDMIAWRRPGQQPLTGFSHGAAGISHALLALHVRTGRAALLDAAAAAIRFEHATFRSDEGNWPDLRAGATSNGAISCLCRWCHGAPGIALSRLWRGFPTLDDQMEDDLAAGTAATRRGLAGEFDNLCCGAFGRIEVLTTVAVARQTPALLDEARAAATSLIKRASHRGEYRWESGDDRQNPGLFTGIAGIGYSLLRLREPSILPAVLMLA